MQNYETKRFFSFAKQLETLYFVFRETIEARRNSDLFRAVSYFAKLKKKYETVNPSDNTHAGSIFESLICRAHIDATILWNGSDV